MDKIREDMMDAEKALSGMEKCCGICVLPWKKYVVCLIFFIVFLSFDAELFVRFVSIIMLHLCMP